MSTILESIQLTYMDRISALRATKQAQTREKIELTGYKDHDDHAMILPPPELFGDADHRLHHPGVCSHSQSPERGFLWTESRRRELPTSDGRAPGLY
jgi:hypothetical protein